MLALAGLWVFGTAPGAQAWGSRDKDCATARDGDPVVAGMALPVLCGPFELQQAMDHEPTRPGLGTSLGYGGPGTATVHVYDKGLQSVPAGIDNQTVRAEFRTAVQEVFPAWQARGADVLLLESGETGGVGSRLLRAKFELRHVSGWRNSYLYLVGVGGRFLKVRVTLPQSHETDAVAEAFAQGVFARAR